MLSQVTIKILKDGQSRDVWFLFDSEHESLFDFNEALAQDGTVYGYRIESEPAGQGRRRETNRYECILSREIIGSVIPSQYELLSSQVEASR